DDLGAGNPFHALEVFGSERLCVGITYCCGHDLIVSHGSQRFKGFACSAGSNRLAHVWWPVLHVRIHASVGLPPPVIARNACSIVALPDDTTNAVGVVSARTLPRCSTTTRSASDTSSQRCVAQSTATERSV